MGEYQSGDNWASTAEGTGIVSIATSLADTPINNANDIGNPGVVLGSVDGFSSVAITEIMYNPASDEPQWEWIEVFNGTSEMLDFSTTPYFFDDKAGNDLSDANVDSGFIPPGETAVLQQRSYFIG